MASFFEDVIRSDSRFNSVKRVADINLLEPVTRSAVSRIVEDAGALGIDLMVFETYRSQARQQELFNQVRRSFGSWESTISDSQLTWSELLVASPHGREIFLSSGGWHTSTALFGEGTGVTPRCPIPLSMPFTCSGAPYLYSQRFFEALSTPMQITTLIGRRVQP